MKIDLTKLKDIVLNFNNDINILEDFKLKYYSTFNTIKDIWKDGYTENFFLYIEQEKKEFDLLINDIRDYIDCFNYLYQKCSNIAYNKIIYDNNTKGSFDLNIYNYINKVNKIISLYNNYINSFSDLGGNIATYERNKIIEIKNNVSDLKIKVNKIVDNLNSNVKNFNGKLSKCIVSSITEQLFREITKTNLSENIVHGIYDEISFYNNSNKLNYYMNEISKIISKISKKYFKDLNNYIIVGNNESINIQNRINKCFIILLNNFKNSLDYINNVSLKYKQHVEDVNNMKRIGDEV